MVKSDPIATFYSPLTRFWELGIGGLLASIVYRKDKIWGKLGSKFGKILKNKVPFLSRNQSDLKLCKDVMSIFGMFLIFISIITFHTEMNFPGKKALIPTLGVFLLIATGENAIVNKKILSTKCLVFIGLISYPLYLWHWPLLSFARIVYGELPPLSIRTCLVLITIFLSWITYRFIEPPLRWGKYGKIKALSLFIIILICGFFFGGGGRYIYKLRVSRTGWLYNRRYTKR